MAKLQGDTVCILLSTCLMLFLSLSLRKASASAYHDRFAMGSEALEKLCFTNGKYYTQVVDPTHAIDIMGDG